MEMKCVFGYLKHTRHHGFNYNKYTIVIEGYNDLNWITGSDEKKTTSDYVFIIVDE